MFVSFTNSDYLGDGNEKQVFLLSTCCAFSKKTKKYHGETKLKNFSKKKAKNTMGG
jgi:hypothetical protein